MASAQNDEPASAKKAELITAFLRLSGLQGIIDVGGFNYLERLSVPGGALVPNPKEGAEGRKLLHESLRAHAAVRKAYSSRRSLWQREYEDHLDWEFNEAELKQIVEFLATSAGQQFLEARGRMDAYICTNTEEVVDTITREAEAALRAAPPEPPSN